MKIALHLFVAFVLIFCLARTAQSDDLADLKKQLSVLEKKVDVLERKRNKKKKSQAHQKALEQKVRQLEEEVSFLQEQQETFLQKIERRIKLNLYGTLKFEDFANADSTFDARNIELFVDANITDRLRGFTEIEFERTATTHAGSREGEVEIEQGWIEYNINPYFNPRFGVILVPFGKFNLEHFDPFRDLTDRPIAMRRVIPTTWSEAGAGFTGDAFPGHRLPEPFNNFTINYQFYFINGLTDDLDDTGTRNARGSFKTDTNNNKAIVGRIGLSPFSDQEIGISGYYGEYNDKGKNIFGVDVDWDFSSGPWELIGEYAFFNLEKGFQKNNPAQTVPETLSGGYVQVNYHFWFDVLNSTFLGRNFSAPTFTAIVRYGEARIDDDGDPGTGDNDESRLTIGFNYRPVEPFAFKIEYQLNQTDHEVLERGNNNGFVASVSAAF